MSPVPTEERGSREKKKHSAVFFSHAHEHQKEENGISGHGNIKYHMTKVLLRPSRRRGEKYGTLRLRNSYQVVQSEKTKIRHDSSVIKLKRDLAVNSYEANDEVRTNIFQNYFQEGLVSVCFASQYLQGENNPS
ncbi:hypothetical protein AVEN_159406-1 [Araneus ventricosus]|uniref:Uncharacterized protein n=1 Tax=Araneus ventricosus TaxID=182803 RepID=A0A4Y2A0V7_ARAVE|nr:hypothetical protein AVEN_159406-1 [Araneus ventricosus]